jgi:hypothetical protein
LLWLAQPLGILGDMKRSPWHSRVRSILSSRWQRKNEETKNDGVFQLNDRLLANVGLYREHRIHNPQSRTFQQSGSPIPVALLGIWMTPV